MKKIFITVLLVLCPLWAGASAPDKKWSYGGAVYDSLQPACEAYVATLSPSFQPKLLSVDTSRNTCHVQTTGNTFDFGVSVVMQCWDGTAPNTTKPLDQQCPVKCSPDSTAGNFRITTGWATGPDPGAALAKKIVPDGGWSGQVYCGGSCTIVPDGSPTECKQSVSPGPNGYYEVYCTGAFKQSGGACSADSSNRPPDSSTEPTQTPPEKNRCPLGTKQIGIDSAGTPICQGDASDTDTNKQTTTTTTTNPDGSKTTTTTTTTTNKDGSKTTTTTTTTTNSDGSQGGSNTTTTTGNTPDGQPGKSDSTDQDKQDLCKQNPSLNICKNSQISGSCESVSCEGDAIQCAIAREISARNCKDQKEKDAIKEDAVYKLGDQVLSGNDPLAGKLPTIDKAATVEMPSSLDASGWLGGGACFPDKTFSIQGRSITISFSAACQPLIAFRYALMIISLLVSFRMLSGVIFRE